MVWCGDVVAIYRAMTAQLQPNDVTVFGPLSAMVGSAWRQQLHDNPEACDSLPKAIEHSISCWSHLRRETVAKEWVMADSMLRGMRYTVGRVDM